MVGSKETLQIRSRLKIITEPRKQRFLSWCMRGFWPPEDDKDESIMSFSSLFTAGPSDIFARYLKVIKTCVKDDTVSKYTRQRAKAKSNTRKLICCKILFNTKKNRLQTRKLASIIFQLRLVLIKLRNQLQASMECEETICRVLDWVKTRNTKLLKFGNGDFS